MDRTEYLRNLTTLMASMITSKTYLDMVITKFSKQDIASFGMVLAMEADEILCAAANLSERKSF